MAYDRVTRARISTTIERFITQQPYELRIFPDLWAGELTDDIVQYLSERDDRMDNRGPVDITYSTGQLMERF